MAQHVLRKMLAPWRTPSSYKLFLSHTRKVCLQPKERTRVIRDSALQGKSTVRAN
jgi:hypothetical protein